MRIADNRIKISAKDLLGGTTQKSDNKDAATIKGYLTKLNNFRVALKAFGKGIQIADSKAVISSEVIATSLFSLRRDAAALEIVPSTPEMEKLYADQCAEILAADPKAEIIGYFAFLAVGNEAKGRSYEMDRILERSGDKAGVFAYHQHTVEQYQALKHAIATWEALEKQL
jgi:hypothetical protein